jgi:hypothetical protein
MSAVRVSLDELYENPEAYDGKVITVVATLTRFRDETYLYPGRPTNGRGFSFIRVDADHIQNSRLAELDLPTVSSAGRKEFDLEITGAFDGKYSGPYDFFKYRLVAIEINPLSGVRVAKPLGAG